jgi:hypothetical protein
LHYNSSRTGEQETSDIHLTTLNKEEARAHSELYWISVNRMMTFGALAACGFCRTPIPNGTAPSRARCNRPVERTTSSLAAAPTQHSDVAPARINDGFSFNPLIVSVKVVELDHVAGQQ